MTKTKVIISLLNFAIVAYLLVFAYYAIFGGFDIDLRDYGVPLRIHMPDLDKPLKIFLFLVVARLAIENCNSSIVEHAKRSALWLYRTAVSNQGYILLGSILLFALFLRVWGLGQGLEYHIYHPDAAKQITAISRFLVWDYSFDLGPLKSSYFAGYPYFAMHIPEYFIRAANLVERITGYTISHDHASIAMSVRLVNVFYSMAIVFMVYKVGLMISGKFVALLSAFLCSVSIIHIHMVKYVGADLPMSFFSLIAIYFALQNLRNERLLWYTLSGLFIGLAMASKYNGVLTFVFVGLIYLSIRKDLVSALKSSGRILQSVCVALIVFFLVNANFWADPVTAFQLIRESGKVMSGYGLLGEGHLAFLWNHAISQFQTLEGILSPVPVWLAFIAFLALLARSPGRHLCVWASPIVIFIIGKLTMPISAPNHYLNTVPLFLIAICIGIDEIIKMFRYRKIAFGVIALGCIYPAYYAIGDTSFWLLKPLKYEGQKWASENVDYSAHGRHAILEASDCFSDTISGRDPDTDRFVVRRVYYDLPPAPSLHRTRSNCLFLMIPDPLFFPGAHWVDRDRNSTIYPASFDLVTSSKKFVTDRHAPVQRLVKASELSSSIAVLAENCSTEKNDLKVNIGSANFNYALAPGEKVVAVVEKPQHTWLYFGEYVRVEAESQGLACWSVGVNHQDIGDIGLTMGEQENAVDSYLASRSPYSLIMAYLNGSDRQKEEAHKAMAELYPDLLTDTYLNKAVNSWNNAANYSSELFDTKMVKIIKNSMTSEKSDSKNLKILKPGDVLYGPYIPLLKGDYTVEIKWSASKALHSFDFDIVSLRSKRAIAKHTVVNSGDDSETVFKFHIDRFMEPDVEFRFYNVQSGRLVVEEIAVKPDYYKPVKQLLKQFQATQN